MKTPHPAIERVGPVRFADYLDRKPSPWWGRLAPSRWTAARHLEHNGGFSRSEAARLLSSFRIKPYDAVRSLGGLRFELITLAAAFGAAKVIIADSYLFERNTRAREYALASLHEHALIELGEDPSSRPQQPPSPVGTAAPNLRQEQ